MLKLSVSHNQTSSGLINNGALSNLLAGAGVFGFCVKSTNGQHTGKRFVEGYVGNSRNPFFIELKADKTDFIRLNEKTSIFSEHTLESNGGLVQYHIGFVFEKRYISPNSPCTNGGFNCRDKACKCCSGLGFVVPYDLVSSEINLYKKCLSGRYKKIYLRIKGNAIPQLLKKHEIETEMKRLRLLLENF